jgi:hypothetical protein
MKYRFTAALVLIGMLAGPSIAYAAADKTVSGPVNIDVANVSVRQAIDTLFEGRGLKYYIQPGVSGRIVQLKLKGIAFDQALKALGDAAGFSFRIEDGAYVIGPGAAEVAIVHRAAPAQTKAQAPPEPAASPDQSAQGRDQSGRTAPVVVNNNISSPPAVNYSPPAPAYPAPYPDPYYAYGGWSPVVNLGSGPYVFGRFPQPPPPPGWVSPDMERLLRFQWAVPTRPGFAAPYPYFYP